MVEVFEALAVHHAGRNQGPQLQDGDRELVKGQLLQGRDQLVQVIQRVRLRKYRTDRRPGVGGGWTTSPQGLPPESSAPYGAWLTEGGPPCL